MNISLGQFTGSIVADGELLNTTSIVATQMNGNVDLRGLPSLVNFQASLCDVRELQLPDGLSALNLEGNADVQLPPLPSKLTTLDVSGCGKSESEVDDILAQLVANGQRGGVVTLVNNTAPSEAGLASKSILVSRDWSVNTD